MARNAYPQRKPEIQVCCPGCGGIIAALGNGRMVECPTCNLVFDPEMGNAKGIYATCLTCNHRFAIAKTIHASMLPSEHRLYAKLVLTQQGEKQYLAATQVDIKSYAECTPYLQVEVQEGKIFLPQTKLCDGYNTRRALNYNYTKWSDFFNQRQLLTLGWLQNAIATLPDQNTRDAFYTLFSGVLEFNNLFATYKGEGTGAVRHLFSHHILKPERMPIEANLWGTPKSSGSFSNLFKTRLLRAIDYRENPFEVTITNRTGKKFHSSQAFSEQVEVNWAAQQRLDPRKIYLSCGSSNKTELAAESIDFVITDPPFFDNVHYSELADFFFAWQSLKPHGFITQSTTTRHEQEVQDVDEQAFAQKLKAVFCECHRVLKPSGLLVFTYHHSRVEGWSALMHALWGADFSVVNAHPIKAEMSVATPKAQASDPIQIDIIFVCRKRNRDVRTPQDPDRAFEQAQIQAATKLLRLATCGLKLSNNDKKIILISQFIAQLSPAFLPEVAMEYFLARKDLIEQVATRLTAASPRLGGLSPDDSAADQVEQLSFSFLEMDDLSHSTAEESFRRGWQEAMHGIIHPIDDLWTEIDAQ